MIRRLKVMLSEVERLERIMNSFLRFTERHQLKLQRTELRKTLGPPPSFDLPDAVDALIGRQVQQVGALARRQGCQPLVVAAVSAPYAAS